MNCEEGLFMKKIFLFLSVIFIYCNNINAQVNNDLIIEQLEQLSEDHEGEGDYSDLMEGYWNLAENPIDINSDEIEQLVELRFISVFQLENIKKYRYNYGDFQFIEELYEVEGLDTLCVEIIKPLISLRDNFDNTIKFKDIHKYGKNKILFEVNQCLNRKKGYYKTEDSLLYDNLNSVYLGSPQRLFFRYNYSLRDKIEAGFVLEKDPGEYIIRENLNDSIRKLLGDRCYSGFDFFSFHIVLRDFKYMKTLAIGDYKLSFGQGLTMGSGLAFISNGGSLLRKNKKISASKSANEVYYQRGIASTFQFKDIELTIFFSNKKNDANVISYDNLSNTPLKVSGLQQNGLHRTCNEILDRRVIKQRLYGINISYRSLNSQIGYTLHRTDFGSEIMPDPRLYNLFYFKGKQLVNQSIDAYSIFDKTIIYGELAMSDNKGLAGLIGTTFQPTGYIEFNILYRNYSKEYQCLYSNSYSAGSNTRNEKGLYLGSTISIASNWRFITSFDYHKSDWFKSSAHSPSQGYEFNAQINYQTQKRMLMLFEYRNKSKTKNTSRIDIYQKYIIDEKINMLRLHVSYDISNSITLKNRAEYHFNKYEDGTYNSYLIYQDILYNPADKQYSIAFRYELFDAEKGSVYAYENDVLYAFAVNSLSGKGIRTYLVGKIKLWERLQLSGKIGFTFYSDKEEIGSGLETIENSWRSDGKLQMVLSI